MENEDEPKSFPFIEELLDNLRLHEKWPEDIGSPEHPHQEEWYTVVGWHRLLEKVLLKVKAGKIELSVARHILWAASRFGFICEQVLKGDEKATSQYLAILRLLKAEQFDLSKATFDEIAAKDETNVYLRRGFDIRRLMSHLSEIVAPLNPQCHSVLTGHIVLRQNMQSHALYREASLQLFDDRALTLEKLACRVYKQRLVDQGYVEVDDSTIYRSIEAVKEWEKPLVEEEVEARSINPDSFRAVLFHPKNFSGTLGEAERLAILGGAKVEYLWIRKYPSGTVQNKGKKQKAKNKVRKANQ